MLHRPYESRNRASFVEPKLRSGFQFDGFIVSSTFIYWINQTQFDDPTLPDAMTTLSLTHVTDSQYLHGLIGHLSTWRRSIHVMIKPERHLEAHVEKRELGGWSLTSLTIHISKAERAYPSDFHTDGPMDGTAFWW